MELQFQTNTADCLQQIMGQVQSQEQTQELKLSDGMPDIGRACRLGSPCPFVGISLKRSRMAS